MSDINSSFPIHSNSVLAGERPAHFNAMAHDFAACCNHARKLLAVAFVKQDQRVQVVRPPGMKDITNL